ncbi:nucleotidyltransferase [Mesorhizobium sp. M2D.F.Ca.ET.185.01.1.1]|uniref:nucleotidyltransferase domain-containing protein n=3 Tax=Mesorhizobium TaxID=68287 RepID=UPI000FC9EA40|nr:MULTISPECIES: nucleotidyltransferase domain-containing protein [unclassified Mesorhizobium]TGP48213.1 nucleotidyltransferase [bacterium M00.F.Ca.ET.230.01.1.1]TGP75717.1 nucleotidyltransferase [bacterium M00.F.Ca.ET.227.01.1.1]TGT70004.1 nucleotidyltransferase [bacterium M00.F.Ca.ET.159.01.1.1]TGT81955.1 nucleotidyltransferase [bacterium M00.F.Ca.ET.157.01.1.1]TGU05424.1 nucleotidyltransferase [bacterium M00.F.Ca.ET.163.01.1.1]TGU23256.1 nucleotidyltransferase [bacterium M00.F.Ca.ET.156.01
MSLPADFAPDAVAAIRARLDMARAQGAKILFAIESGSRAWGFPSPDSDYDCRFVYIRPVADHLVLEQPRDVLEFPLEGEIDAGGWDLRKALLLALGGNAVIVEWAKSLIVYEEMPGFRQRLLDLLAEIVDPAKVSRHYLGLARSHVAKTGSFAGEVKLKKLFYLIRPIVALDWMEQRDFARLPPMNMVDCLAETAVPAQAASEIRRLIEKKRETRELGTGPIPAAIARYLEARYGHHEMNLAGSVRDEARQARNRALATDFYRREAETQ